MKGQHGGLVCARVQGTAYCGVIVAFTCMRAARLVSVQPRRNAPPMASTPSAPTDTHPAPAPALLAPLAAPVLVLVPDVVTSVAVVARAS